MNKRIAQDMMVALKKPAPSSPAPRRFIKFKNAVQPNTHPVILVKLLEGGFQECDDSLDVSEFAEFAKHMAVRVALALLFFAMEGVDQVEVLFEILDLLVLEFNLSGVLFDSRFEAEWHHDNPFSETMWEAHFLGRVDCLDANIREHTPAKTFATRRLFQSKFFHGLVLHWYLHLHAQFQGYINAVRKRVPEAHLLEVQMYVLEEAWFTKDYHFVMSVDPTLTYRDIQETI
jgi:hypothetical protein